MDNTRLQSKHHNLCEHRQKTAMERIRKRGEITKFEEKYEKFIDKVTKGFEETFKDRKNFKKIDGNQNPKIIAKESYEFIKQYTAEKNKTKTDDEPGK